MVELLVGRDDVLDDLAAHVEAATTGPGRLVLVSGAAGVGKTTVVRALVDSTPAHVRVAWGACDALVTPRPLGPLADLAGDLRGIRVDDDRHEVFSAVLDDLAATRSLVVVEDIHWGDDATLDWLVHLGRRIQGTRSLVVATYRHEEVERSDPLARVLGMLATAPGTHRIRLQPLSRAAVERLASGGSVDVERLYQITGGNPFYVTEVLATPGWVVPPTVTDAVRLRASRLADDVREVFDTIAVEPGPVRLDDLQALGHRPAAIDSTVSSGMVVHADGRVVFRHELARLAIVETLTPTARRRHHQDWLALLTTRSGADGARIAHHALGAHDDEAALAWSRTAAEQAVAAGAHREAVAHLQVAVDRSALLPPAEQAELMTLLASQLGNVDRPDDAVDHLRHVVDLRRRTDQDGLVEARALLAGALWSAGDGAGAREVMAAAVAGARRLPAGRTPALVYARAGHLAMLARRAADAIQLSRRAIELARPGGHHDIVAEALNALGSSTILSGETGAGIELLRQSAALAAEHGLDRLRQTALGNLGSGLGEVRAYDLAVSYLDRAVAFAVERDLDAGRHYSTAWKARVRFEQGRWDEARRLAGEVPTTDDVSPISQIVALTVSGRIACRQSETGGDDLQRAWALAQRTGDLQRLWPVVAGRAEATWLAGDESDDVVGDLDAVLDLAIDLDMGWAIGEVASWLARLGHPRHALDGAAEPFRRGMAGDHAGAAAAWRALGCPYEYAQARADVGDEASLREGLAVMVDLGATPLASRVRRRLRALGAVGIPAGPRGSTAAHPAGLTPRQAEVLVLVARGLSDRQIAEHLFISPKTVGHHVSAVLATLGVDSRTAAAILAVERGWT